MPFYSSVVVSVTIAQDLLVCPFYIEVDCVPEFSEIDVISVMKGRWG